MKKFLKVLKWIGIVILVIIVLVVLFFGMLTVTEYKPDPVVDLDIRKGATESPVEGTALRVVSWNVGYGSLGENADFFMDGGTKVMTSTTEGVYENLSYVQDKLDELNPQLVLFQEVDEDSKRSHHINEVNEMMNHFADTDAFFTYNYKTKYVPYPIPPIGKVQSGLVTLSKYQVESAERVALPCPFKYPVRLGNLKRCLEVSRIPVEGSDKELVIVNLHLEAYDSGEGKIAQTKQLKELLESEAKAGNYVIAAGDFNQAFSNVDNSAYPKVSEEMWMPGSIDVSEFGEGLSFLQDNSVPTCRSLDKAYAGADKDNFQFYLIDGFIVSSNVKVQAITTIDTGFKATDHNPIVLDAVLD